MSSALISALNSSNKFLSTLVYVCEILAQLTNLLKSYLNNKSSTFKKHLVGVVVVIVAVAGSSSNSNSSNNSSNGSGICNL